MEQSFLWVDVDVQQAEVAHLHTVGLAQDFDVYGSATMRCLPRHFDSAGRCGVPGGQWARPSCWPVLTACGATEPVNSTSVSPERAGRPPAALLEQYGVSLPADARDIHYREVLPRSGGTLYVRMRVPDTVPREWLTVLGGSASDLTQGWSPVISHELRESGWRITTSDSLFGTWIPIAESGPKTSKKVVIAEDASERAKVYLMTNR
ncbi:hypothetical protein [Streptomyces sp. NPDC002851]